MTNEKLAGNTAINSLIHSCFEHIHKQDKQKFIKKFKGKLNPEQKLHIVKELILGAYLSLNGFNARYSYNIDNKTPDWCILNDKSKVVCIVELVNFSIDKNTKTKIDQFSPTGVIYPILDKNFRRLHDSICHKANRYQNTIKKLKIPYVIAVTPEFEMPLSPEDLKSYLFNMKPNIFEIYPEVSGVLHFEDQSGPEQGTLKYKNGTYHVEERKEGGRYPFKYFKNTNSLKPMDLPSGSFLIS